VDLTFVEDAAAWDDFVASSEKPHIMQSWAWGELKSATGWRPYRVRLGNAGLSLLERDFPKIGRRFFYACRGPVVASGWKPEELSALFSAVGGLAARRSAAFLKIDPDVPKSSDWITPVLDGAGFRKAPASGGFAGVQPACVFRLDISRAADELLAAMDQKTRYNIRLAEKKGVSIRPVREKPDLDAFYKVLVETAERDGFMIRSSKYFHDMQALLGRRGQCQFFLAEREGAVLGGALAVKMGPVCWYLYGASSNEGREYMPNHLMQWTLIRWAKAQGCRLYDFRAVPCDVTPDHPLHGLYRFKKGFGGALTEFVGEYDLVYSPALYAFWTRGWPVFKRVRKLFRGAAPAIPSDA
jgi:peptidoglycan pentaglycine glycine transferase (the first glycine)